MKKLYIIIFLMIAAAIGLFVSAAGDVSTYSRFKDAEHTGKKVKIVGQLSKDKDMHYNPEEDPNYFTFFMKDDAGVEKKVVLLDKKPQDFERSEQIVVTGKMKGEEFYAKEILLKCPSKYKDEEIYIKNKQAES